MFVRSLSGVNSWSLLKEELVGEFGAKLAAIDVHRMLKNRKKKGNESFREYLYAMVEIGKPIKLDNESLIQYFVDGIPDSKFGKSILYQAIDIHDLKDKLKIYEKIRGAGQQASTSKPSLELDKKNISSKQRKCYKCGEENHMAEDCKSATFKCFKCGKAGHKSFECKTQPVAKKEPNNSCMVKYFGDIKQEVKAVAYRNFKDIKVNGVKFSAIVDSGSDVSIIRFDVYQTLGDLPFIIEERDFITAGEYRLVTMGYFETLIYIDGIDFKVKFYIARNFVYMAAIGNDILEQADIIMTATSATFVKKGDREDKKDSSSDLRNSGNEFETFCAAIVIEENVKYDLSHLPKENVVEVKRLIKEYTPERRKPSPISMKLILTDEIPVYQRPRRLSYADQIVVEQQIKEWIRDGIVQPSTSEYSSPIVLVNKKDGSKRLCCDFRKLNEKVLRDNFPMVLMDDVLHKLQSARMYTTLDLRNGFFHVPVEEGSRKYTSFVTRNGQYVGN